MSSSVVSSHSQHRANDHKYNSPHIIDLTQIVNHLNKLLHQFRGYLTHQNPNTKLENIHNLATLNLKNIVNERFEAHIVEYIEQHSHDKLTAALSSLQRSQNPEQITSEITDYVNYLRSEVLSNIQEILGLLSVLTLYKENFHFNTENIENKAKALLYFALYSAIMLNDKSCSALLVYCKIDHNNLIKSLISGTHERLLGSVNFDSGSFEKELNLDSEHIKQICHFYIREKGLDTGNISTEELKRLVGEIVEQGGDNLLGISDENIKHEFLSKTDREELKTVVRKNLGSVIREKLQEKEDNVVNSLKLVVGELKEPYDQLRKYFDEGRDVDTEREIMTEEYLKSLENKDRKKLLDNVEKYENYVKNTLENLRQLEDVNNKAVKIMESVEELVNTDFKLLVEGVKDSFRDTGEHHGFEHKHILDKEKYVAGLSELLGQVRGHVEEFLRRFELENVRKRLNLMLIRAENEVVGENGFTENVNNILEEHKGEDCPFYLYSLEPKLCLLQVLNTGKYRLFYIKGEDVGNVGEGKNVQKVVVELEEGLKGVLDVLRESKQEEIEGRIRSLLLGILLWKVDYNVKDEEELGKIELGKDLLKELLVFEGRERLRRAPEVEDMAKELAEEIKSGENAEEKFDENKEEQIIVEEKETEKEQENEVKEVVEGEIKVEEGAGEMKSGEIVEEKVEVDKEEQVNIEEKEKEKEKEQEQENDVKEVTEGEIKVEESGNEAGEKETKSEEDIGGDKEESKEEESGNKGEDKSAGEKNKKKKKKKNK